MVTSAAADSDRQVSWSRVSGVDFEHRLERRQNPVLDAWTSHSEQTG